MPQMKEQEISGEKPNKMEINNLPDKEFKEMVKGCSTNLKVEYTNSTLQQM